MEASPGSPLADVRRAFAPIDKTAFCVALGVITGTTLCLITAFHLIARPEPAPPIHLLGQYFYGYSVTWTGALVGWLWGACAGFIAGWFVAFARNLVVAISIFTMRTKAELAQTSDFLDHL